MAGLLNRKNWSNLIFGFRGNKGDGKGAPAPGASAVISWEGDGSANLAYWDMSNRVKILCKAHEHNETEKKKMADKETRVKEMREELQNMGFAVTGGARQKRKGGPELQGSGKGARKSKTAAPALEDADEDEDEDGGLLEISEKEAFLACKTAEKIGAHYGFTIKCGDEANAPISLTDVADLIINHKNYSRAKVMKERQALYGMKASSAGSKMSEHAIVASLLAGHLGKLANKL